MLEDNPSPKSLEQPLALREQVVGTPLRGSSPGPQQQPPPGSPVPPTQQQPSPGPAQYAYLYSPQQSHHIVAADPRDLWQEPDLHLGPTCLRNCCFAGWCPCLFVAETSKLVNDGFKNGTRNGGGAGGGASGEENRRSWWRLHAILIGLGVLLRLLSVAGWFISFHDFYAVLNKMEVPLWLSVTIVEMDWRRKVGERIGIATERDDVCVDFVCMCCFPCCFLPSVKASVIHLSAITVGGPQRAATNPAIGYGPGYSNQQVSSPGGVAGQPQGYSNQGGAPLYGGPSVSVHLVSSGVAGGGAGDSGQAIVVNNYMYSSGGGGPSGGGPPGSLNS